MTRGQFVTIAHEGRRVRAMVGLASPDAASVVLLFDALIDGCLGALPLLRDAHGIYRNIFSGHAITITEGEAPDDDE